MSKNYDNLLILGDLNSELEETCLNDFFNVNNLKSLNKKPTCFKNPENPSCIDLFLTNRQKSFQNTSTIETGISDFHKLVVTVLKMYYKKQKPKIFQYRNYKIFNEESFKNELNRELTLIDLNNAELADFQDIYLSVLNKHTPVKHKYIRASNSNFMTKNHRKEIMLRSKFRNVYLKTRTNESKQLYNKQRNLCVTLFRKAKKDYFSTLDNRIVSDNRKIWKAVNPLFSEKTFQKESITLIDKETFYSTMVENLKIDPLIDISNVSTHPDPILRAIETYKNHSSVLKIKAFMRNRNLSFSFSYTTKQNISKALKNLDQKKACQGNDIPVKMIKFSDDIVSDFIYHNYNNSLFSTIFPSVLQKADISPIHKKKSKLDIENYRPVSILLVLSKIYERCMFDQMYAYFNNILSKHQCGFRQSYSMQHSLLLMIEKFKKSLDNGNLCGMLLTDLSKAFDCLKSRQT